MDNLTDEDLLDILYILSDSDDGSDINDNNLRQPSPKRRKYQQTNKRSCWVRPFYQQRDVAGAHATLVSYLRISDPFLFRKYMRLSPEQFEEILCGVAPLIIKQTIIRKVICPSIRLALTLRYLATGESQISLSLAFRIAPSTTHKIIVETTAAISQFLKLKVFPPISKELFVSIANGFNQKWNFPHCLGAVDGKHVVIQAPANSGSLYFNYKKTHSIVLMAICDHNYKFISCDIGAFGRQSDGGVFRNSHFGKKFYNGELPVPATNHVTPLFKDVPYVFVADDAFALNEHMLKPYGSSSLEMHQRVFNYRLSRARRIIENSFGIMSAQWRIYRTTINALPSLVESIIEATVCLHNYLRLQNESIVGIVDDDNTLGSWRNLSTNLIPLQRNTVGNSTTKAKELRNRFAEYFIAEGSVEWQLERI